MDAFSCAKLFTLFNQGEETITYGSSAVCVACKKAMSECEDTLFHPRFDWSVGVKSVKGMSQSMMDEYIYCISNPSQYKRTNVGFKLIRPMPDAVAPVHPLTERELAQFKTLKGKLYKTGALDHFYEAVKTSNGRVTQSREVYMYTYGTQKLNPPVPAAVWLKLKIWIAENCTFVSKLSITTRANSFHGANKTQGPKPSASSSVEENEHGYRKGTHFTSGFKAADPEDDGFEPAKLRKLPSASESKKPAGSPLMKSREPEAVVESVSGSCEEATFYKPISPRYVPSEVVEEKHKIASDTLDTINLIDRCSCDMNSLAALYNGHGLPESFSLSNNIAKLRSSVHDFTTDHYWAKKHFDLMLDTYKHRVYVAFKYYLECFDLITELLINHGKVVDSKVVGGYLFIEFHKLMVNNKYTMHVWNDINMNQKFMRKLHLYAIDYVPVIEVDFADFTTVTKIDERETSKAIVTNALHEFVEWDKLILMFENYISGGGKGTQEALNKPNENLFYCLLGI